MNETPAPLWRPSAERIAEAGITRFQRWLRDTRGLSFDGYEALWQWSVDHLEDFWAAVWSFCGVISHTPYTRVLAKREMPGAQWFEGATLNYAEHLLAHARESASAGRPAIVFESELSPRREVSWAELAGQGGALAATLRGLGVGMGDRVVAYMPNIPQTIASFVGVSSIGAVWSSCSPDMGPVSVLDRFRQIEPRVLFAVDGYRYGGKNFDRCDTVRELVAQLPSVQAVILVSYLGTGAGVDHFDAGARRVPVLHWEAAVATPRDPEFLPVPFDHPLWIVYSSGTTGMPKPIVHGHGGSVVENLKGCTLHLDLRETDRFLWYSSTSWIMWNFTVGTLMTGNTVLLYDGNPGYPDLTTLWRFAERERATFFGTSPAFIALNMKAGLSPRTRFDLSALRTLGCTGSPLTDDGYRWVYEHVHPDILLASISGGTDPNTAFLAATPVLPIYPGEMQCRGLGCALYAYDDAGRPVLDQVGELVCAQPMPSMPLYFWGDRGGHRYFDSYFDVFPGPPYVWRHGDWLKLVPRPESVTGVIYGRSDSTINRYGIRMGTSELYRVVEEFAEVADSLVVDLEYLGRDSFMALFVVLREPGSGASGVGSHGPALSGEAAGRAAAANAAPGATGAGGASGAGGAGGARAYASDAADTGVPVPLKKQLFDAIRTRLSARHVPNDVFAIPEVPRTISGKKMEVPVKKILLGHPPEKSVNRDSMANPGSIDWFLGFARGRGV